MITIKTTAEKVNEAIERLKEDGEISVRGNTGEFEVMGVSGRYMYELGELNIVIDDKPWLISDEYVEQKIRDYFN